jgi:hypothetical protein
MPIRHRHSAFTRHMGCTTAGAPATALASTCDGTSFGGRTSRAARAASALASRDHAALAFSPNDRVPHEPHRNLGRTNAHSLRTQTAVRHITRCDARPSMSYRSGGWSGSGTY